VVWPASFSEWYPNGGQTIRMADVKEMMGEVSSKLLVEDFLPHPSNSDSDAWKRNASSGGARRTWQRF
jgi:hypothetical protein